MKAIRYYRPIKGRSTRISFRIFKKCQEYNSVLFVVDTNSFVVIKGMMQFLDYIDFRMNTDEYSKLKDFVDDYEKNSPIVLCVGNENDKLLMDIFEVLVKEESNYIAEGYAEIIPNFGHPELIDISVDGITDYIEMLNHNSLRKDSTMNREELAKLKKDYVVIVDYPDFVDRALELGFEYAEYQRDELSPETIRLLEEYGKNVVCILCFREVRGRNVKMIDGTSLYRWDINLNARIQNAKKSFSLKSAIECFPNVDEIEAPLIESGIICDTDYTDRCGNCHNYIDKDDKYCRYCGTPRGEGEFKPFKNMIEYVYGSPMETKHRCTNCGYSWTVNTLGRDRAEYCPKCAGKLETENKYPMLDGLSMEEIF